MTAYFHGSAHHRFEVGEIVRPGREIGRFANVLMHERVWTRERQLRSGRSVDMHDLVWLTPDATTAENWASHSLLKATAYEIRQLGGIGVYEVEPIELVRPLAEHGEGEACCTRAKVIREVSFEAFELDRCDDCGELATVGLGSERQLCGGCS